MYDQEQMQLVDVFSNESLMMMSHVIWLFLERKKVVFGTMECTCIAYDPSAARPDVFIFYDSSPIYAEKIYL